MARDGNPAHLASGGCDGRGRRDPALHRLTKDVDRRRRILARPCSDGLMARNIPAEIRTGRDGRFESPMDAAQHEDAVSPIRIIAQIRAVRDEHAARFGYDVEAIFRDIRARQEASGPRIRPLPGAPCSAAPMRSGRRQDRDFPIHDFQPQGRRYEGKRTLSDLEYSSSRIPQGLARRRIRGFAACGCADTSLRERRSRSSTTKAQERRRA